MQFGKQVKAMMVIRELNLRQLAALTGIHRIMLSRACSGRVNLRKAEQERVRLELCMPPELDKLFDKIEGAHYDK